MTARAKVALNFMVDGVDIYLAMGDRLALSFEAPTRVMIDEAGAMPDLRPLQLREDVARALYEELGQYFGGMAADQRLLRKDYEAERKRVDSLIETVSTIAKEA